MRAPPLRATAAAGDVPATVSTLWRYPIKGFPPDSLASGVSLKENGTFPQDRLWAVADAADDGGFDAAAPQWVHKQHFFGAFRSRDRLASLNTSFANGRLTFYGSDAVTVDPSTKKGRATIEDIIRRRVGAATRLVTGGESPVREHAVGRAAPRRHADDPRRQRGVRGGGAAGDGAGR